MRVLTDSLFMMLPAMLVGAGLMIWHAERINRLIKQYRRYETLGLFILLVVGIMLVSEGGSLANLYVFDKAIEPMSKVTFYLLVIVMIVIDGIQGWYKKAKSH